MVSQWYPRVPSLQSHVMIAIRQAFPLNLTDFYQQISNRKMSVGLLSLNSWDGVSQPAERIIRVAVVAVASLVLRALAGLHLFPGGREVEPGPLLALKHKQSSPTLVIDLTVLPSPPLPPLPLYLW